MATITKRAVFALAALTIGSFALAACSSGAPAGDDTGSDTGADTGSSDDGTAAAESYTVLTTDELGALLEGAGLTLVPQDQVEQAVGGAGASPYDSVEPAACETLFSPVSLLTDDASVAMGTQDQSMVLAGAFSYPDSSTIDMMFDTYSPDAIAACPEYTATVSGEEATGTVTAADVTVEGADQLIALTESASMSGMDLDTSRVIASKDGVLINATSMGGDIDAAAATVTEILAALP